MSTKKSYCPKKKRVTLTAKEEALVLALRADGMSNEAIAEELIRRREPLERLRYHVSGAVQRGEGQPIVGIPYQPKTGAVCGCKPGMMRDNCPNCEGTGMVVDFRAIREKSNV